MIQSNRMMIESSGYEVDLTKSVDVSFAVSAENSKKKIVSFSEVMKKLFPLNSSR